MKSPNTGESQQAPPESDSNPFKAGCYDGRQFYDMTAEDRVRRVKDFDRKQCLAALQVEGLQRTVEDAVLSRLRKLRKLERNDQREIRRDVSKLAGAAEEAN